MARDWIKMRFDLSEDPAVIAISSALGVSQDDVIGKLHRLWCWADKHTKDGKAPSITPRWVDKYVGHTGFSDAMVAVNWLLFDFAGITFPNFAKHNGEIAKSRAENTIRQRLSRKQRDEGATGDRRTSIPAAFRKYVMSRDEYRCVYCGRKSDAKAEQWHGTKCLSIDHLTPEKRGGNASVDNLVCCCSSCNNEKNDRTPEEWGLRPSFLARGVAYESGLIVETLSRRKRDTDATPLPDKELQPDQNGKEEHGGGRGGSAHSARNARASEKKTPSGVALGDLSFPAQLDTDEARASMEEWLDYKRARGEGYKRPQFAQKMLNEMAPLGSAAFVASVNRSISSNYAGLFAAKEFRSGTGKQSAGKQYDPTALGGDL